MRGTERAKMGRKQNALLRLTETAWPNANRKSIEKDPCEPTTAIGNRTKEDTFTTMVSRAVKAKMAKRFARKTLVRETGRWTKFAYTRRTVITAYHRLHASDQLTV